MKTKIDLTREEILEFENLELKFILANKEIERLRSLQRDLAGRLKSRSGADLTSGEWRLDLGAGLVARTK